MGKHIQQHRLTPGDEIVLPKSIFNVVQHHAFYLGTDHQGQEWMIENKIDQGVILTSVATFFASHPTITRINRFTGSAYERRDLVEKALRSLGRAYSLINFNCEHFTTEVRTGKARSRQIEKLGWGLAVAYVIGIFLTPSKRR